MNIFKPEEMEKQPRADMYLPMWLLVFGFLLDAMSLASLVIAIVAQNWFFLIAVLGLGLLGIAAFLCWKNQTIKIIDEFRFEYTTFLGQKRVYYFSDIKELRPNADSWTLILNNGKVHIESIVCISDKLVEAISASVECNEDSIQ